jgi:hypothetical protein
MTVWTWEIRVGRSVGRNESECDGYTPRMCVCVLTGGVWCSESNSSLEGFAYRCRTPTRDEDASFDTGMTDIVGLVSSRGRGSEPRVAPRVVRVASSFKPTTDVSTFPLASSSPWVRVWGEAVGSNRHEYFPVCDATTLDKRFTADCAVKRRSSARTERIPFGI